jgi:SIR2-like domain
MNCVLLLGAGFTRNWGGWLAVEAFEYLLGCPETVGDPRLRDLLWKHQTVGGFEDALAELQLAFLQDPRRNERPLTAFQNAVTRMFDDMNRAFFAGGNWDPDNAITRTLLTKCDAIFTLNQDVFLEQHYLNDNIALIGARGWAGPQIPGMRRVPAQDVIHANSWARSTWVPLPDNEFRVDARLQPFFKLHGSSNWPDPNGRRLLVMGGGKAIEINQSPILKWYAEEFSEYLSQPNTRLMVIGYGFRDEHINDTIKRGVDRGLRMFIISPEGAEVAMKLNPTRRAGGIAAPTELEAVLQQALIGASRRQLREIFRSDIVEYDKVTRFFAE